MHLCLSRWLAGTWTPSPEALAGSCPSEQLVSLQARCWQLWGLCSQFPALAFSLGCCQVRPAAPAIHSPAQIPAPLLVLGPGSETEGSACTKRSLHRVLGLQGYGTEKLAPGGTVLPLGRHLGLATHLHGRELGGRVMSSGNFGSSRERFDKRQEHVRCR